jgi:hypothetical protein
MTVGGVAVEPQPAASMAVTIAVAANRITVVDSPRFAYFRGN